MAVLRDALKRSAAVSALLVVLLLPGTTVHAASFPYHESGAVECLSGLSGGVVQVNPPRVMRPTRPTDFRDPEQVYWEPVLDRRNGGSWRFVARGPQFFAFTSSYGFFQAPLQAAWHQRNNPASQDLYYTFNGLAAGKYRVTHKMWWFWGRRVWHLHRKGRCNFV